MKNAIVPILTGIFLLIAGTYVFYLYGYKEMMLVYIFSFLAIAIGWILLIMGLILLRKPKVEATVATAAPHNNSGLRGFWSFLLFFGFVFLLIAHYIYLFFLSSNRVEKVLATQPAKITTATVIELKERHSKTGSKQYAVLNYHTDNGDRTAEIKDSYNEFAVGNNLTIKYSIEYPDMFEVVQQP